MKKSPAEAAAGATVLIRPAEPPSPLPSIQAVGKPESTYNRGLLDRKTRRKREEHSVAHEHDVPIPEHVPPESLPGAISIGGFTVDPTSTLSEHLIEAQLAPDDAEIEARIAARLENQITAMMNQQREVTDSSLCGLKRNTVWMLAIFLLLVIGGVVGGVVYSLTVREKNDNTIPITSPTTAVVPSAAPTALDDPLLEKLISWNAIADEQLSLLSDRTSPQSQALTWLKDGNTRDLSTEDLLQRYVLAVLYFTTSGRDWHWEESFLTSDDVCSWNNGTGLYRKGVYCLQDQKLIDQLHMPNNNLNGPIPSELALLTNLESINLDSNRLSGSIPTRIRELTQLQTFSVAMNDLTGGLPTTFSSKINTISLRRNNVTGTFPQDWATSMPNLQFLDLGANDLTGPLPTRLGQLSHLSFLGLKRNSFSGTIPSELGQLSSLEFLWIQSNLWTGTIPSELGQLRSLSEIDISSNQLTGTIPSELGQLSSLEFLWIYTNELTGTIPSELGQLSLLSELDISSNQLTGTPPSELVELNSMAFFDFYSNSLTGSLDQLFCAENRSWDSLVADCEEVDCTCCTSCCWDDKSQCS